jgi:hypothetical protein
MQEKLKVMLVLVVIPILAPVVSVFVPTVTTVVANPPVDVPEEEEDLQDELIEEEDLQDELIEEEDLQDELIEEDLQEDLQDDEPLVGEEVLQEVLQAEEEEKEEEEEEEDIIEPDEYDLPLTKNAQCVLGRAEWQERVRVMAAPLLPHVSNQSPPSM